MIWTTWRQFRTQSAVAAGLLGDLVLAAVVVQREVAAMYSASGVADCASTCAGQISTFLAEIRRSAALAGYVVGVGLCYIVPALIGAFWGAPLVARELETGTFRLAWNQSVTRTRWLLTKLLGIGLVSVAATALLSVLATWSMSLVDSVSNDRLVPWLFGARGVIPIGYAVFAFTLGVFLGMVIRRTVPAMAATLAVYVAAVAAMSLWVRAHLAPVERTTLPLDVENLQGFVMNRDGTDFKIIGDPSIPGAWILGNDTIGAGGRPFTGPLDPARCGTNRGPRDCVEWLGTLGLRQDVAYHPLSQFWALQWAETGVFLGLAALLGLACVWWVRRLS
jgi:hypothetical protein